MFLGKDDIHKLTGSKIRKKQVEWLGVNGIKFYVNQYGDPVILTKHIEKILGAEDKVRHRVEPDESALKARLGIR